MKLWTSEVTSDLLRMAESSTQGMLVAPSTRIPSLLFPTPKKPEDSTCNITISWLFVSIAACPVRLTLHLDQELGLDATRRLALVLVPGATQRVHLIDENDGGLLLASQVKQVLHQSDRNKEAQEGRDRGAERFGARRWEETYFSLSPSHFDMRSEEETEKNVELLASVATALAR